jgi:hypothetical protein
VSEGAAAVSEGAAAAVSEGAAAAAASATVMSAAVRPGPSPASADAALLASELQQIRELSAELTCQLERVIEERRQLATLSTETTAELTCQLERVIEERRQLETLSTETTAELLVLLTALRPLRLPSAEPPARVPIDEYIEDMIDPEFGLAPARRTIVAAAARILEGYDALRFPQRAPACAPEPDED